MAMDVEAEIRDLKRRVGIVLQSTGVDPYLTVRETVTMYAGYYERPRRVDEVIDSATTKLGGEPIRGSVLSDAC